MEAVESIKLLQLSELQEEFQLDSEQIRHLATLRNEVTGAGDPVQEAARTWQALENSAFFSPAQLRRLKKLVWKNRGEAALANPEFRERLRLNPRQGRAVESVLANARAELDAPGKDPDRGLIKRNMGKELVEILSLDQRRVWKHLISTDEPPR